MSRKLLIVIAICLSILGIRCSSDKHKDEQSKTDSASWREVWKDDSLKGDGKVSAKNDGKGIGKFKDVKLTHPLDEGMITKAQPIYESKCFACHKLTDEKLVGPGWKGVTDRRTPEWIMNFIVNTNVMLDSDLVAQAEMITCVVRMPNQSLTDAEARQMLEFMRRNDGKK